jgi:hypothetical protein
MSKIVEYNGAELVLVVHRSSWHSLEQRFGDGNLEFLAAEYYWSKFLQGLF